MLPLPLPLVGCVGCPDDKRLGLNIETFLFVVDAKGWSIKLATTDAFRYLKGVLESAS